MPSIAGVRDIDFSLSKVSGRQAHAQALLRRLTTPRGSLIAAPTYGYDVTELVGGTTPAHIVEQRVREQCLLDERTEDVVVQVTKDDATGGLTIEIEVDDDNDGEFTLILSGSSQLTAQLI